MKKEVLSACIGFVFGMVGILASNLVSRIGPLYWPCVFMLFVLINVCIVYYGEWLVEHLHLLRKWLLPAVVIAFAASAILPWWAGAYRRAAAESAVETILQKLSEEKDIRPLIERSLADLVPIESYYRAPLDWDKGYFANNWSDGRRFTVTCLRISTSPDQFTRATPASGTTTFNYRPEDQGMVRVSLLLDNGKWNPIYDISIVHADGKWTVNGHRELGELIEAVITDMESARIRQCYARFYEAYTQRNSADLAKCLSAESAVRLARVPTYTVPGSTRTSEAHSDLCQQLRFMFNGLQLPSPDDIGVATWSNGHTENWFALDRAGMFVLRQIGGADLLYFKKTGDRKEWRIYLP